MSADAKDVPAEVAAKGAADDSEPLSNDPRVTCDACGAAGNTLMVQDPFRYCDANCLRDHEASIKRTYVAISTAGIAAELEAATLADTTDENDRDYDLWNTPPRPECPICMISLPLASNESVYSSCCGKTVCAGCMFATIETAGGRERKNVAAIRAALSKYTCPFCRQPSSKSEREDMERTRKRMEMNDGDAFFNMAGTGVGKVREFEYLLRASELGSLEACYVIACKYEVGEYGERIDASQHKQFLERAVKGGHVGARCNLGRLEAKGGNLGLAYKHWRTAAAAGDQLSLTMIKEWYKFNIVSKDDFSQTLRAFQAASDEEKSKDRDRADTHLIDMRAKARAKARVSTDRNS